MVRKGYIQQQIEGLGVAFGRLLGIRSDPQSVIRQQRESCKELTGLDLDVLLRATDDTVLSFFSGGDRTRTAGNAFVAAQFLIDRARTDPSVASIALRHALLLHAEALALEPTLREPEYVRTLFRLSTLASGPTVSPLVRRQLIRGFEACGKFSRAIEQAEALDRETGGKESASLRARIESFYGTIREFEASGQFSRAIAEAEIQVKRGADTDEFVGLLRRIAGLPDETIAAGGVTRAEIEAKLEARVG